MGIFTTMIPSPKNWKPQNCVHRKEIKYSNQFSGVNTHTHTYLEVNYGKESDSMEKIEKTK